MRKFQVQQIAITRRRQVKWSKDRDVSEFRCQSVCGHQLHMTGEKTSVHKQLLSAGDVTDKGHALWLDENCWLHHPERFTDSDSDAHVLRESL